MRPQAGGGVGAGELEQQQQQPSRARKRSSADLGLQPATAPAAAAAAASNATPTSLLLGRERDVEAYLDGQQFAGDSTLEDHLRPRLSSSDSVQDSTYGVRSISESGLVSPLVAAGMYGTISAGLEMENEEAARFMARRRSTIRPVHASSSSSAATNNATTTTTATAATRRGSTSGLSSISGYTNETSPGKSTARSFLREHSNVPISQPLTPMSHASPASLSEAPPSPRSSILIHSDDELETGSQAILSSGEEDAGEDDDEAREEEEEEDAVAATGATGGLQLVMPSLLMPSRRPFTERGKQLGKLKVLLAGASGSGKTSLIKSIIQTCEDVVHIDPQSPSSSQIYSGRRSSKRPTSSRPTRDIMEIAGSTKPYPGWWAEVEESQILRRRRKQQQQQKKAAVATKAETTETASSSDEEVLERNICFVDTPGYDRNSADVLKQMEPVLQYLQAQMAKAISPSAMHDSELLGYLGGAGGSQIDVVLYLFGPEPTSVEVDFYDKLSKLAYVIPLLAKSDLIAGNSLEDARSKLAKTLRSTNQQQRPGASVASSDVFSICSSTSNDLESMDASLLMTSGYIEPLHPSQLPELVDHIFQPQRAAFLKHVAAKKLVAWRYSSPHSMAMSPSPLRTNLFAPTLPLSPSSPSASRSPSSASAGRQHQAPLSPTSAALTYTSSRLLDHKQREERMAKLHLGHWADSLRRNLAAERMRYEALANADRERWLKDRLNECVFNGAIVQTDDEKCASGLAQGRARSRGSGMSGTRRRYAAAGPYSISSSSDELDPLAIMKWRRHVLGALQVVGGFSIMSAVALWMVKTWEWEWEWLEEYGVGRLQELLGAPVDGIGAR